MPYRFVEPDYILVHADLNMLLEDQLGESDKIDILWRSLRRIDPQKVGGRCLVTGNVIQLLDLIVESLDSDWIRLDNGAFMGTQDNLGNLATLKLDTRELVLQPWCYDPAIF